MKSEIIKPPQFPSEKKVSIFLGGSIEMGLAELWQEKLEQYILEKFPTDVNIFNPRRDDWDKNLPQDPTPGTVFYEQVMWELDRQHESNVIVYYFDSKTVSAITLLELGCFKESNIIVKCNKDYFRYGNVKIFCDKHNIPIVNKYEELEALLHIEINRRLNR